MWTARTTVTQKEVRREGGEPGGTGEDGDGGANGRGWGGEHREYQQRGGMKEENQSLGVNTPSTPRRSFARPRFECGQPYTDYPV